MGAGFSGLYLAYRLQQRCENVELVIYEKNHDVGGTWLENTYPGVACDIPAHVYSYSFLPNTTWSQVSIAPRRQPYRSSRFQATAALRWRQ